MSAHAKQAWPNKPCQIKHVDKFKKGRKKKKLQAWVDTNHLELARSTTHIHKKVNILGNMAGLKNNRDI